ncbi:unnamed protein product [Linum trigynum]|uniref:Transcription factor CBF/NF-Y/archaeal histone domain-containing protein n=1 Tax=Linum trigynum TaxID=586398 RepID=A0AAV2E2P8_9ROSI
MAGKRNQSRGSSPTSGNFSDDGGSSTTTNNNKEQDKFLPIANVSRIMKKSLPANAKISKEAKETVQECVSEFISFVTGEASDKCQREKRKTVNGDDLLWAMTTLGFESYVGPLKVYLGKYRETEEDKVNSTTNNDNSHQQQQIENSVTVAAASPSQQTVSVTVANRNGHDFMGGVDSYYQRNHHHYVNGGGDQMMSGPVFSMGRPAHQGLDLHGYGGPPAGTPSSLVYTLGVHPHQAAAAVSAARLLGYSNGGGSGGRAMAHQFN